MKPLVIYHNNCADGFGAAYAAWTRLGDTAEYFPMQYGYSLLPDFKGRDVYMLDFSWSKQHMDDLFSTAKSVVWLDHHKTAFEMWCGGIPAAGVFTQGEYNGGINPVCCQVVLDNNRSGALIAWEHFHPGGIVPSLIRYIDDYDRWQFKLGGTKEINKAIWSYTPWTFEQWAHEFEGNPEQLAVEGSAILRAHDQNVQAVIRESGRQCEIRFDDAEPGDISFNELVFTGLSANCPAHLTSDVGHELAIKSGTFGLLWRLDKDGVVNCSLRSNGDYDITRIAKRLGGGGHKNAGGFRTDMQTLLRWVR